VRCSINFNNKGSGELRALQGQQSHRIKSFVKANCWGIFPGGKEQFKSGDIIEWAPLIPSS
jgi:molybdopterin biosynthesis enzyme